MSRNKDIIAWNELDPTEQAILWAMARYETEISEGRNPHRVYTVTKLYHFAHKFYAIKEEEFCRELYAMAEGTDLVDALGNEVVLRVPHEAVLQQNSSTPHVVIEKLTDAQPEFRTGILRIWPLCRWKSWQISGTILMSIATWAWTSVTFLRQETMPRSWRTCLVPSAGCPVSCGVR